MPIWRVASGNWAGATAIPGAVFTGSRDGVLRAYSAKDGKIIWEYRTKRDYETVNGVPGKGGVHVTLGSRPCQFGR